jgi:hypothetical protein
VIPERRERLIIDHHIPVCACVAIARSDWANAGAPANCCISIETLCAAARDHKGFRAAAKITTSSANGTNAFFPSVDVVSSK